MAAWTWVFKMRDCVFLAYIPPQDLGHCLTHSRCTVGTHDWLEWLYSSFLKESLTSISKLSPGVYLPESCGDAETISLTGSAQEDHYSATFSYSCGCWKLTNYGQGCEGLEMSPSAHLASLSNQVLISDKFSGFREAAWPCLTVGGADKPNREHRVGGS